MRAQGERYNVRVWRKSRMLKTMIFNGSALTLHAMNALYASLLKTRVDSHGEALKTLWATEMEQYLDLGQEEEARNFAKKLNEFEDRMLTINAFMVHYPTKDIFKNQQIRAIACIKSLIKINKLTFPF